MKQDSYRWAQMQARKQFLADRRSKVEEKYAAQWGHPIHGIQTPFVESFDSAGQAQLSSPPTDDDGNPLEEAHELPTSPHILDHHLTKKELDEAISLAEQLNRPRREENRVLADPVSEEDEVRAHEEHHRKAVAALERIVALDNASQKSKTHANIRRCIETFGRHETDKTLRPKPRACGVEEVAKARRAGPDTGSSEVQIAILTAKIRVLSKMYFEEHKGRKDRVNRRNLRLLLHRRQKLLKYMQKKERGSERWTHMIEKLGLSPATWEKQIEV